MTRLIDTIPIPGRDNLRPLTKDIKPHRPNRLRKPWEVLAAARKWMAAIGCATLIAAGAASCASDGDDDSPAGTSDEATGETLLGTGGWASAPWVDGRAGRGDSRGAALDEDPADAFSLRAGAVRASVPEAKIPGTMGVYGFVEGEAGVLFNNQKMYWRYGDEIATCGFDWSEWPADNDWPYDPAKTWLRALSSRNYLFYAYAPYMPGDADPEITNVILSYDNFRGMRFNRVKPLSTTDLQVTSQIWRDQSGRQPSFRMEHLTARLRLLFSVSQLYDEIRDIRVREVKVHDMVNGYYWAYDVVATDAGISVDVSSLTVYDDPSAEPLPIAGEYEEDTSGLPGLAIGYAKGYQAFGSLYAVPQNLPGVVVTVVYDVYDLAGVLTRSMQEATNTIDLTSLGTLERGHYYDLRIMVTPDYLYVLSDNDVVPDGLVHVVDP